MSGSFRTRVQPPSGVEPRRRDDVSPTDVVSPKRQDEFKRQRTADANREITSREQRPLPRTLPGATILQIVPSLRNTAVARTAVNIAYALLQSGARAVIAGEDGPLVAELHHVGGEWLPLSHAVANPFKIRRNATALEQFIASEHVDLVHAQSASAAWSALAATVRAPVWVVTNLPELKPSRSPFASIYLRAIAQGDCVIAPSNYVATLAAERQQVEGNRLRAIPRAVDTATYNPARLDRARVTALLQQWRVRPGERVILVPGPLHAWNGQTSVVDAARLLINGGVRGIIFVLLGDAAGQRQTRALTQQIATQGLEEVMRVPGPCPDMASAFGAADAVIVPALKAPAMGRVVAEAQAMGCPVIVSDIGALPENLAAPPRYPEELRTGWLVKPGDAAGLAQAIIRALSLDPPALQGLAVRARQLAEMVFSPQSVAAAHRDVYTSLLARDG